MNHVGFSQYGAVEIRSSILSAAILSAGRMSRIETPRAPPRQPREPISDPSAGCAQRGRDLL